MARAAMAQGGERTRQQEMLVATDGISLLGTLSVPPGASGIVVFAHGSGSGRHSPRNRFVAQALQDARLGTLLVDLLTAEEEEAERWTRHHRFDIQLLAHRLAGARDWLRRLPRTRDLPVGYFGASTGAGAALVAAAWRPDGIAAIVSRGGRPDLAGDALRDVKAPTLLIVGGHDLPVIEMNRTALRDLPVEKKLHIVPGATHLFEEPGALEQVTTLAKDWFTRFMPPPADVGMRNEEVPHRH